MNKTVKKAIAISATSLMLLSPMAAFAQPGYYIGDKKFLSSEVASNPSLLYDLNQLMNQNGGLNGLVLDLDAQGTANYGAFRAAFPNGGLAEFTEWARTHAANLPPSMIVHADGTETPDPDTQPVDPDLTVVRSSAVNATTISVTFSDNVTQQFTVATMVDGDNTRTVTYQDETFTVTVHYDAPVPVKSVVESITFKNYRHVQVKFNTEVDLVSAENPANYYFEIIDGNAGLFGLKTLQASNQLSKIETDYPGGAAAYWADDNIVALNEAGKTVVNIYLPEDARFTTVEDNEAVVDVEQTLYVGQRDSQNGPETFKALIKDRLVNVAVRNVKDADGDLSIDTSVKPIMILDQVNPYLEDVYIVDKDGCDTRENGQLGAVQGMGKQIGPYELIRTRHYQDRDQVGQKLIFQYSEPVFDGHGLDKSDIEGYRDLALYVNGKKIASLSDNNLNKYMDFNMGYSTYDEARMVSLDAEKAVKAAEGEYFTTGKAYNIHFVGVTDLAGNIEVASEHYFNVTFVDQEVDPPVIVKPVVLDVDQVADNMFRVEFNREGVSGKLEITNADGEGGVLKANIPASTEDPENEGVFYSYVAVNAMDNELFDPVLNVNVTKEGCWLAYDGQDYIDRAVKVTNVIVKDDDVAEEPLLGDDFSKGTMRLVDDILAPVAEDPVDLEFADKAAFDARGTQIVIPVKDLVPWTDDNITYDVNAIKYNYDKVANQFSNEIDGLCRDYLPIKVSYVADGVTRTAMVSNRDLRPADPGDVDPTYLNPGFEDSITFDQEDHVLILDLENYANLLDEGKLVADTQYKIEIPKGYFTDPARDIVLGDDPVDVDGFGEYDLLYVDDARIPQLASIIDQLTDEQRARYICRWKELGYTSTQQTLTFNVDPAPPEAPIPTYVPQTSKELIRFDAPTNSLWVEFTATSKECFDQSTVKDPANYILNGKSIKAWDQELGTNTQIDFVVEDDQYFATFIIPQDSIREDGDVQFTVSGVAHPDGAIMTPVTTVVAVLDNSRPVVTDARVTGQRQIVLTFNEPVQYLVDPVVMADQYSAAKNFKVTAGGIQLTVLEAVLPENLLGGNQNDPSERELTLNLGSDIPDTGDLRVEIVKDQNGNLLLIDMSENRNAMKMTSYTVSR